MRRHSKARNTLTRVWFISRNASKSKTTYCIGTLSSELHRWKPNTIKASVDSFNLSLFLCVHCLLQTSLSYIITTLLCVICTQSVSQLLKFSQKASLISHFNPSRTHPFIQSLHLSPTRPRSLEHNPPNRRISQESQSPNVSRRYLRPAIGLGHEFGYISVHSRPHKHSVGMMSVESLQPPFSRHSKSHMESNLPSSLSKPFPRLRRLNVKNIKAISSVAIPGKHSFASWTARCISYCVVESGNAHIERSARTRLAHPFLPSGSPSSGYNSHNPASMRSGRENTQDRPLWFTVP
jgi:hypothetical protein